MIFRNSLDAAELPALYEIEKGCFQAPFLWSQTTFNTCLLTAAKKNNVWVAEENGKILGFLLADKEFGKGYIDTVDVSPKARGRGIATKLIGLYEAAAKKRGLAEIKLEVSVSNPAQVLYFKLGYRVTAFRRNYYKLHYHALTMAKKL
jgi:ribosomal protein S18 acetylase RimI-like enzyme